MSTIDETEDLQVVQLSQYYDQRKLFDYQRQMVGEMLELEEHPLEMELYKSGNMDSNLEPLRALWHRGFLTAPVGSGKTAMVAEFLLQQAHRASEPETSLIVVPLNLFAQWRDEIELMEDDVKLRWVFLDSPCELRSAKVSRVIVIKTTIFNKMAQDNKDYLFKRFIIDEADSIKLQWRVAASLLCANYLWYVSATFNCEKPGHLFYGRRFSNAIGVKTSKRPIVYGSQETENPQWAIETHSIPCPSTNFEEKMRQAAPLLTRNPERANRYNTMMNYALGNYAACSKLATTVISGAVEMAAKLVTQAEGNSQRDLDEYNENVAKAKKTAGKLHSEGSALAQVILQHPQDCEGVATLHDCINRAIRQHLQTTTKPKILLIGDKPATNVDSTRICGIKAKALRGRQSDMEKTLSLFAGNCEKKDEINCLMLDSGASNSASVVAGMNLQHTTCIIFADPLISPEMKKQATGRALRLGRPFDMNLAIFELY